MKFAITSKGDTKSNNLMQRMRTYLQDFNLKYDEDQPDIVISVGGDGTLLYAFHRYKNRLDKTAFVGVHTGHLGFYADWTPDEIEKLVIALAKTPFQVVEYPLLETIVRYQHGGREARFLALNESTVKSVEGTLVMDVEIRGQHFERFRGDGLCIATPSGSTAYNKALGGAIIHPSIDAIQVTELASINNRVFRTIGSPLLLPAHHTCTLRPVNDVNFQITVDHLTLLQEDVKSIQCRVADEKIRFARFRPFPFWKRVHDSFIAN
ncbi:MULTISPECIES: NAD kinase [Peribacillus]|uniref:NAD kinase n=1 Tax=Peribacillus asahii TaxID=228899 RepID=A0A3Q9RHL8_9BACI|nr:NAD kinase [Peribacillus asahii]AZV41780.1 inorganic polyphosphate kinase [Peribacillus asahii]USK60826.1 NAD kinase [Peribacillus asahii]USK71220.1 NAD kinase [Peribacillus asahii]USK86118.1 NAD kinase [Peribacillus asahii]